MKNNVSVYILTCVAVFGLALAILFGLENTKLKKPVLGPQDWRPMSEKPIYMPPVPPVPERYIKPEPKPDSRTIDVALIKGSVLILKNDATIESNSCCTWQLANNNGLAYGFYVEKTSNPRVLPEGSRLTVIETRKERTMLPGNVFSMRNQNAVITATTQGGAVVYLIVTAGDNLKLVGTGSRTQYQGVGRIPTVDELRNAFEVDLAGPEVIRAGK